MGIEELNGILWEERSLLDALQFALETQSWVVSTGRVRWLSKASDQVREIVEELRHAELLRASEAEAVAAEIGIPSEPTLAVIAAAMSEPWRSIMIDQRDALLEATRSVGRISQSAIEDLAGLRALALEAEGMRDARPITT